MPRWRLHGGRTLHVVNVHLRRARRLSAGEDEPQTWRTMSAWAEGFFLAAVKRGGQALEVRLLVDQLFDADADALIVVCGDFNADVARGAGAHHPRRRGGRRQSAPGRAHPGSGGTQARGLAALLGRPPRPAADARSSPGVAALLAWYRGVEIHNEALGDELVGAHGPSAAPSPSTPRWWPSLARPRTPEDELERARSAPKVALYACSPTYFLSGEPVTWLRRSVPFGYGTGWRMAMLAMPVAICACAQAGSAAKSQRASGSVER